MNGLTFIKAFNDLFGESSTMKFEQRRELAGKVAGMCSLISTSCDEQDMNSTVSTFYTAAITSYAEVVSAPHDVEHADKGGAS